MRLCICTAAQSNVISKSKVNMHQTDRLLLYAELVLSTQEIKTP